MASEEDLQCPVCFDVFTDPVLLLCSHSVCRLCLQQFWSGRGAQECPVCRKRFTACSPPANLALRNVCESFLQRNSSWQELCEVHGEKLKLFCLDDKHPVCLVCRDSEKHLSHSFRPVDEVAPLLKEELNVGLKHLQEKLESLKDMRQTFDEAARHIKAQAQQTLRCLQEEFERLHQFLRDEEMSRISALIDEENLKSQIMKDKIQQTDRDIESLSNHIRALQEDLAPADVRFLQNFKVLKERVQITRQDPEMHTGALMNVAEHLGNLKFKVWEKMQDIVQLTPVTLDPNTAHPLLSLTDDLTHVQTSADGHQYPENPERFDYYPCVLGSEGFHCGTRCWDVEVQNNTCWSVGVTAASNRRKGAVFFGADMWRVRYMGGQYTFQTPLKARTPLAVEETLKVIRVMLDWDGGKISFSDPLSDTHLCSFSCTFTEAVFPFLNSSCQDFPLKILPVNFRISVKEAT